MFNNSFYLDAYEYSEKEENKKIRKEDMDQGIQEWNK